MYKNKHSIKLVPVGVGFEIMGGGGDFFVSESGQITEGVKGGSGRIFSRSLFYKFSTPWTDREYGWEKAV